MRARYIPEALAEYEAAAAWYDDQSPGAGDDFADAIERAVTKGLERGLLEAPAEEAAATG